MNVVVRGPKSEYGRVEVDAVTTIFARKFRSLSSVVSQAENAFESVTGLLCKIHH